MNPSTRSSALLILCSVAFASDPLSWFQPARAAAPAPAPDSARIESTPAPLIVPPPPGAPRATSPSPQATTPSPQATTIHRDTAIASARRRARETFGRGLMLEEQKAYSGAIVSYTNAARMDPTLRGPSFRIGLLYASRQQWDPAARAFREEMRRHPNDRAATKEYALMLVELGDTTRPVRMLEQLTRQAPGDASLWRALGFAYGRRSRYADAEKALRGSVALDANSAKAWRDLGVVLAARDKPREAREAYRRALVADPRDESSLVNLANLESRLGDHARALEHYHAAERLDSTQARAYRGQIRELVALDREADAGEVWRRWLARAPHDSEIREGTARHFARQLRADVALAVAREGVRLAPGSGEAWWLMGEVHVLAADAGAALAAYREAGRRFKNPADLARVESSITALRVTAPDSLRARFAADSVEYARPDSTRRSDR